MADHKINYRSEYDAKNGCIHSMAKYARCLIWKRLCPRTRLRMKVAIVDANGKKIRRRNAFDNFDPVINIDDHSDDDESIERKTQSIKPFLIEKNKESSESLDEYKEKLRAYGKKYNEYNGPWFNINDIETVSLNHFMIHNITV